MAGIQEHDESEDKVASSDGSHLAAPEKSATGAFSRSSAGENIASAFLDDASGPLRRFGPFLALMLQVTVIVFILVSIAVPVPIQNPGMMSVPANAAYALSTTLIASLIAAYTLGQVRILWLQDLLALYADKSSEDGEVSAHTTHHRVQQARALLGIGNWQDWFRFPQLTICAAMMAGMAGAIVAGVTPSPLQSPKISWAGMDTGADPSLRGCWNYTDTPQDRSLAMPTLNGSFLIPTFSHGGEGNGACLTDRLVATLAVDNLPATYLYRVSNALVNSSALGTPINYINAAGSSGFDNRPRRADDAIPFENLLAWSSCAPNLISNPVQCKPAPNGTITKLSNGSVSLSAGSCQYTDDVLFTAKGDESGSTVGHLCPTGPGQATLILGALDEAAHQLNFLTGEHEEWNITSYAITCTVDVWPSIGSREIEWSRMTDPSVAFYSSFVVAAKDNKTSETSCELPWIWTNNGDPEALPSSTPKLQDLRTDGTLFAPLAALQALLDENQASDGYPQTLYSMAALTSNEYRKRGRPNAPYAFPQSKTSIEDALGVVVAAALSLQWGDTRLASDSQSAVAKQQKWVEFKGTWIQQGQRVGSGEWWTVAYLIPDFFAILVIITFLVRSRRRRRWTSGAQRERRLRWLAGR